MAWKIKTSAVIALSVLASANKLCRHTGTVLTGIHLNYGTNLNPADFSTDGFRLEICQNNGY